MNDFSSGTQKPASSEPIVDVQEPSPGVALVVMQDRISKNGFTDALILSLFETFDRLARIETLKVIVLTGFDTYFSTGGTQDGLLALQAGQSHFAATPFYSLPMDCPIPVVAAMQGHGIGGGFVLGLFADFVLLGRESVYTTNFMKYGFTPGMGATYIVPNRFGSALGQEMLMLARTYRGEELKQRGIPYPVLPRLEVLPEALKLAQSLAQQPRHALVTLKRHLTEPHRAALPRVIEQELAMHQETMHQAEVRSRILEGFRRD